MYFFFSWSTSLETVVTVPVDIHEKKTKQIRTPSAYIYNIKTLVHKAQLIDFYPLYNVARS